MLNLEFSTFHVSFNDIETIHQVMGSFAKLNPQTHVKLKRMHWMTSWSDLISVASFGSGPDISQIGDTWISSLTGLNAIRPFQTEEISPHAAQDLFSTGVPAPLWAMPWTKFSYVVCYRKDLLAVNGIDPKVAFSNQKELTKTAARLKHAEKPGQWLIPFVSQPYPDLLHIAAAWVWGAGGDFLNCDQRIPQVVFHKPQAIHGLTQWVENYRSVSPGFQRLNMTDCVDLFANGQATAVVANIRMAAALYENADEATRAQLGFAPLSEAPWVGGDSLVIWKHTRREPRREQMALELVQYLTSAEGQRLFCRPSHSMPAHLSTQRELYPAEHPLHDAIFYIHEHGRRYPAINQWRPVENQLIQELDLILQKALLQADTPAIEILNLHIPPLAERLNRTLGN